MKVQRYRSIPGMESGFPRVRCKVRFTVTQHKAICGQKEVILKLDLGDSVQQNKFIGGYWILPLAGWMFSPSILFPCYDTIPLALWCPSPLSKFSSLHLAGEFVKIPVWYFLKESYWVQNIHQTANLSSYIPVFKMCSDEDSGALYKMRYRKKSQLWQLPSFPCSRQVLHCRDKSSQ